MTYLNGFIPRLGEHLEENWEMQDDYDMKPCPFCGGNDLIYRAAFEGDSYYCNKCKAYGPLADEITIKEKWNTRADTKVKARRKQVGGDHYKNMSIQPGEFIRANNIGWYEGNAIKYICRYRQKGGGQDIDKAIHYLELLKEEIENDS